MLIDGILPPARVSIAGDVVEVVDTMFVLAATFFAGVTLLAELVDWMLEVSEVVLELGVIALVACISTRTFVGMLGETIDVVDLMLVVVGMLLWEIVVAMLGLCEAVPGVEVSVAVCEVEASEGFVLTSGESIEDVDSRFAVVVRLS